MARTATECFSTTTVRREIQISSYRFSQEQAISRFLKPFLLQELAPFAEPAELVEEDHEAHAEHVKSMTAYYFSKQ